MYYVNCSSTSYIVLFLLTCHVDTSMSEILIGIEITEQRSHHVDESRRSVSAFHEPGKYHTPLFNDSEGDPLARGCGCWFNSETTHATCHSETTMLRIPIRSIVVYQQWDLKIKTVRKRQKIMFISWLANRLGHGRMLWPFVRMSAKSSSDGWRPDWLIWCECPRSKVRSRRRWMVPVL